LLRKRHAREVRNNKVSKTKLSARSLSRMQLRIYSRSVRDEALPIKSPKRTDISGVPHLRTKTNNSSKLAIWRKNVRLAVPLVQYGVQKTRDMMRVRNARLSVTLSSKREHEIQVKRFRAIALALT